VNLLPAVERAYRTNLAARVLALPGISTVHAELWGAPGVAGRALGANAPRAAQIPEESGCRVSALRVTILAEEIRNPSPEALVSHALSRAPS